MTVLCTYTYMSRKTWCACATAANTSTTWLSWHKKASFCLSFCAHKVFGFEWNLVSKQLPVQVDERYKMVCHMTQSKVTVMRPSDLLNLLNSFIFQSVSLVPFAMWAGKWLLVVKLGHNISIWPEVIIDILTSFCVTWLNFAGQVLIHALLQNQYRILDCWPIWS